MTNQQQAILTRSSSSSSSWLVSTSLGTDVAVVAVGETWKISWLVTVVAVTFCGDGRELTTTFTRSGDSNGGGDIEFFRAFRYHSGLG